MDIIVIVCALLPLAAMFNLSTMVVGVGMGYRLKRFSLGFGPGIVNRKIGHTRFILRLLPIGGCVNFVQEAEFGWEEIKFHEMRVGQRVAISIAGPATLLVLGLITLVAWDSRIGAIVALLALRDGLHCLLPFPAENGFVLVTGFIPPVRHLPTNEILPSWLQGILILIDFAIVFGMIGYFVLCTQKVLDFFNLP